LTGAGSTAGSGSDDFHFGSFSDALLQLVVVMTGGLDYDSLDAVRSRPGGW
jgi:hypothetical protein